MELLPGLPTVGPCLARVIAHACCQGRLYFGSLDLGFRFFFFLGDALPSPGQSLGIVSIVLASRPLAPSCHQHLRGVASFPLVLTACLSLSLVLTPLYVCVCMCVVFLDKGLLSSPGWAQTYNPLAPASCAPGF